jgi:glycosyltransferase involved in cell wall biosynthesis
VRLLFVIQRFGAEVAGGAEALCRSTARALSERGHDITVLTSTARDYLHWSPYYEEGTSRDGEVAVRRFSVEPPDPERAGALVRRLGLAPGDETLEGQWARAQGPVCPGLLGALARDDASDAVVFWTYLYATTQLGLPLARGRSVLVPLAHDEPMLRFGLTRAVIASADALAFLTPEERRLVDDLHGIGDRPNAIVGTGLEPPLPGDPARARRRFGLPARFVLYLGRLDAAKGVDRLIRQHEAYRRAGGELGLVLAGRGSGALRVPDGVLTTGFVSEQERADLLAAAEVVARPSPYESLSLVALEAWQSATPTLANARCEVVAGQTARSQGGLLYDDAGYVRQLTRLARDEALRRALGEAGRSWVAPQTWDACAGRWDDLLSRALSRTAAA